MFLYILQHTFLNTYQNEASISKFPRSTTILKISKPTFCLSNSDIPHESSGTRKTVLCIVSDSSFLFQPMKLNKYKSSWYNNDSRFRRKHAANLQDVDAKV